MLKHTLIFVISAYKTLVSPLLARSCRHYPSCSEYTIGALEKHGSSKGLIMGIMRILRCNQFFKGGFDPVK